MGTNVKKVVRNILCVAGVIILLVLSSIGGMYIERNHQETLEMQKEHISTIAADILGYKVVGEYYITRQDGSCFE